MTDDPFSLRRFGFYSEQDIAVTREMMWQKAGPMNDTLHVEGIYDDLQRPPDLDAFLRYWTPERIARRKREETTR